MTTTITVPAYINSMGYQDWWCPCGITPSDVVAAYAAKGAANYAASKVNLANPGTYDLTDNVSLSWNATDGWIFTRSEYLYTASMPFNQNTSLVVKFSNCNGGYFTEYTFASLCRGCADSEDYWLANADGEGWSIGYNVHGYANGYNAEYHSGIIALSKGDLYMDGNFLASDGGYITDFSSSSSFEIGGASAGGYLFSGYIQAVSLYSTKLSQAQIQSIGSSMP